MKNLDELLESASPGDTINLGPYVYWTRGIRRVCLERNTYSRHPWKSRLKGLRGDAYAIAPVTWIRE